MHKTAMDWWLYVLYFFGRNSLHSRYKDFW